MLDQNDDIDIMGSVSDIDNIIANLQTFSAYLRLYDDYGFSESQVENVKSCISNMYNEIIKINQIFNKKS